MRDALQRFLGGDADPGDDPLLALAGIGRSTARPLASLNPDALLSPVGG